jgi:hypothetical protein
MKITEMKNILVPTDFSVQSLQLVHDIVKKNQPQPVSVYLVHMLHMPTDILDLLFVKKYQLYQQVPDSFNQATEMLKNKYLSRIKWMGVEFYYGSSASILNDIIENRKIHEVCVLDNYSYSLPLKRSVNMIPLVKRSKVPVSYLQLTGRQGVAGEANLLSSLFTEDLTVVAAKKVVQPV